MALTTQYSKNNTAINIKKRLQMMQVSECNICQNTRKNSVVSSLPKSKYEMGWNTWYSYESMYYRGLILKIWEQI